ncbi:MAG: electron transfer flavoprotein subunit alpha/FixB family protein [Actinobacteria bacterium]|nr:electron transfer flavoprotein subunit alpha/FixB family protein [Actinomycetota bacterium]MBU1944926.1 electron transfer flavoprotein subunit alpha/FixB family protein [Actinomycetota bacterium]MBU2688148.1 electron transfer flavoprotein subunit alpha/FixB family protein [Actinomycetota bacterium]
MVSCESPGILVLTELVDNGLLTTRTRLLVGLAQYLTAGLHGELIALVTGNGAAKAAREAASLGVDTVLLADSPSFGTSGTEALAANICEVCAGLRPRLVVAPHTQAAQDFMPMVAFRLGTALVTDCVGITAREDSTLVFTKPIYGGNALAEFVSGSPTTLATVRIGSGREPTECGHAGSIVPVPVREGRYRLEVLESKHDEPSGPVLEEAGVVVAGGRGLGGPEGFDKLRGLADTLGGAVGASRPPCDLGWADPDTQVGITGKIVAPDIYIAVAISGSSQHLTGMSDSGTVVALNNDPDACIFNAADYGVVADWQQVLPAFSRKVRELLGS